MRAIEMTGIVDSRGQLLLESRVPIEGSHKVRVLILVDEVSDEPDEAGWLKAASQTGSFDFLRGPGEDVYSDQDGVPFDAQG